MRGLGGTAPSAARPFPGLQWTGDYTEERVRFEASRVDATHEPRIADGKLAPKVMRFELELAVGGHERRMLLLNNDQIGMESIAASDGFAEHRTEVGTDRRERIGREPEAMQLRMVAIAARATLEDPLRKEGLSPESHKPLRVKVSRVEGPESHRCSEYRPAPRGPTL